MIPYTSNTTRILEQKAMPSLSFLMITLASGIVPMKMPPGRSNAETFDKACRARASVDHE